MSYDEEYAAALKALGLPDEDAPSKKKEQPKVRSGGALSGLMALLPDNETARKAGAVTSGASRLPFMLAGLPVDTAINLGNLLKAAGGVGYHELTGKSIPNALMPTTDRENIFGTQANLERSIKGASPLARDVMEAGGAAQEFPALHAAGLGGAAALTGRMPSSMPQTLARFGLGSASGGAAEKTYQATGDPALSIAASMAIPTGIASLDSAMRAAIRPSQAGIDRALAANREGIPVGLSDVSDSPMVKSTRSMLSDMPIVKKISDQQRAAKQGAYHKAVGRTFDADGLDPIEVSKASTGIKAEMDRIYSNNNLVVDQPFRANIRAIINGADELPSHEAIALYKKVKDLRSHVTADPNTGQPIIEGNFVNNWQSSLRRDAERTQGALAGKFGTLRKTVIEQFNNSVSNPDDAYALSMARAKYKAYKTVEPLIGKSEAGVAGAMPGEISAAMLPREVLRSYGDSVFRQQNVPDLARVAATGSRVIPERVLQTGGSPRSALQNLMLLTGAGAVAAGGAPALGAIGALGAGSAGLNWALGSPSALRYSLSGQSPSLLPSALGPMLSTEELINGAM